jgi:hypothetical protein
MQWHVVFLDGRREKTINEADANRLRNEFVKNIENF